MDECPAHTEKSIREQFGLSPSRTVQPPFVQTLIVLANLQGPRLDPIPVILIQIPINSSSD
jgi:hypothetical protein